MLGGTVDRMTYHELDTETLTDDELYRLALRLEATPIGLRARVHQECLRRGW
jgi:hypothetical protein